MERIDIDGILPLVRRPSQYLGGWFEPKRTVAGESRDISRICLFSLPSARKAFFSDRKKMIIEKMAASGNVEIGTCFLPDEDFCDILRRDNISLFAFDTGIPLRDYDLVIFYSEAESDSKFMPQILDMAEFPVNEINRRVLKFGTGEISIPVTVWGDSNIPLSLWERGGGEGWGENEQKYRAWHSYDSAELSRNEYEDVKKATLLGRGKYPVQRLRIRLERKGLIRFISHREQIDLIRWSVQKTGWPVCYSDAVKPRLRVAFGPAISVGYESESEYFDVELWKRLDLRKAAEEINLNLPPGFFCVELKNIPVHFPSLEELLNLAVYAVEVKGLPGDANARKDSFLTQEHVNLVKVKAGREEMIDLKPLLRALDFEGECKVKMTLRFGPKKNLKPERILQAMFNFDEPATKLMRLNRKALYHEMTNGRLVNP